MKYSYVCIIVCLVFLSSCAQAPQVTPPPAPPAPTATQMVETVACAAGEIYSGGGCCADSDANGECDLVSPTPTPAPAEDSSSQDVEEQVPGTPHPEEGNASALDKKLVVAAEKRLRELRYLALFDITSVALENCTYSEKLAESLYQDSLDELRRAQVDLADEEQKYASLRQQLQSRIEQAGSQHDIDQLNKDVDDQLDDVTNAERRVEDALSNREKAKYTVDEVKSWCSRLRALYG